MQASTRAPATQALPGATAERGGWLTPLLVALVPFGLLAWRFDFLTDDAYITFRYARNWAAGLGLVYNPGVDPPVEGYSEPLWAWILGLGLKVGLSPLVLSRVLSVASGVVVLALVARLLAGRVGPSPVARIGAALFLGCLPPLGVWATGGLATMPFSASLVALFYLLWAGEEPAATWKLALAASVALLLRADGAWWVAWLLGGCALAGLRQGQGRLVRRSLWAAGIAAGVLAAHVAWRLHTYGDWLPNTARAKVGLSAWALERGSDYLVHFLLTFPGVLFALLAAAAAWGWRERRVGPAIGMVLASALHAVLAGGDFMAFGRFLVPALPFVALVLGASLAGLEARGSPVVAGVVTALCVGAVLPAAFDRAVTPAAWRAAFFFRHNRPADRHSEVEQWRRMNGQVQLWADLGRALARVSKSGDSLVFGAVGAIGWHSGLLLYDRNGLVTREVAEREPLARKRSPGHDKTVPPAFFARHRPTYLEAYWYPAGRPPPEGAEILELPGSEDLRPGSVLVVLRGDRP